jgi:hypothetical protein
MRKFVGITLLMLGGAAIWMGSPVPVGAQGSMISVQNMGSGDSSWSAASAGSAVASLGGTYLGSHGDVLLSGLNTAGALAAARDIHCRDCQVQGNVSAGRDIRFEASPQVGSIAAGRDVALTETQVSGSISAGHEVTLAKSRVQGNLSTGSLADLKNSAVQGTLALGGPRLNLDASTVARDVYFQGAHSQGSTISQIAGYSGGSLIRHHNGGSFVRVGPNSLSRVNGYTVQGGSGQTTVITPGQSIYVNGRKVSGEGPKTYTEARQDDSAAPMVEGPGWSSEQKSSSAAGPDASTQASSAGQPVVNWLELSHNSQINGQVVFESGYGKVLLHPGSRVNGKIVNGTVEHLPN